MSSTIRRIYPIRKSRKNWFIRLFANHDCDIHQSNKCEKDKMIEDSLINLNEFDIDNPKGYNGQLINPESIVIPDNKIHIIFDYPMINITSISLNSKTGNGFTLKELINSVKNCYKYIYEEEAKTATEKTYELEKLCSYCLFDKTPLQSFLIESKTKEKECPICYTDFNENETVSKLRCNHSFHQKCISEWINFEGKTCPICRTPIKECKDCNGKLVINYSYTGTVIPVDQRGIFLNRNLTNGKFGIYGLDFEDLYLEGFWYDKRNKNVRLFMSSL
jgi:hypothetical protein